MKRLVFFLSLVCGVTFQMVAAQPRNYDVNLDGEVNIADINAVIHAILGGIEDSSHDVHRDGEVNIGDINNLVDRILGDVHHDDHLVFNVGNASFKMIRVDGGTFMMGNNSGKSNEWPFHGVTLAPYRIGGTEVTQVLWRAA